MVRVPYTFAVARFGGRNWTIITAALLLVPTVAAFVVMEPGTSYNTFLRRGRARRASAAATSPPSMTNINAFFPLRKKGWALGLNAGGGNIGVPVDPARRRSLVIARPGAAHPRLAARRSTSR